MQLVPVIDLMDNLVVQGQGGDRSRYQPVQSQLTDSSYPLPVARAMLQATGSQALYIADLDAIQGRGGHLAAIQQLSRELSADLWVDAGLSNPAGAAALLQTGAHKVIIGSETLPDLLCLDHLRDALPTDRLIFSLDTRDGRVLSRCPKLASMAAQTLLGILAEKGWEHIILLSLGRVGTGRGPDLPFLKVARSAHPTLNLVAGGGIRSGRDVQALHQLEMNAALVATALHRGWIRATSGSVD